ncbi:hypothetical protein K435DRAFT_963703 [Dendrothele bispora CBS 962.96]|uniref:Myb-like domain-containing protein n=1 Tax=Dendrothele bispora (strain CBS 962.96) TaxID=1314807 RepID=A0A4S8MFT1_DENBC|nr:hypothetical protein K435DRAFT_963703 [Dendrothele bispora CBS 962.96]
MDNPQYYQPLSHALDPPRSAQYAPPARAYGSEHTTTTSNHQPELNEHNDSDDDEGLVEEQLARHDSDPASPQPKPSSAPDNTASQSSHPQSAQSEGEPKRRPGRPRGSKNRRGRPSTVQHQTQQPKPTTTYQEPSSSPLQPAKQGTTPPQLPEVNTQNQAYHEFQWRVLNLCAEFYGAAEQLVKATSPLVIAQCYQMGPGNKLDPLVMLTEAKNNCDALIANPSKLIANPPPVNPPPVYSSAPTLYAPAQPPATVAPGPAASTSKQPTVISQPQSFVVPMSAPVHYSVYPPPAAYPTASYYQYPYGQPYYAPPPVPASTSTPQPHVPVPAPAPAPPAPSPTVTAPTSATGNQGAWSDEEVERLKKLSAEARAAGQTGDAEWDWIVNQWGNGRTKRQILLKATQLGLKDAAPRGVKRRRENDGKEDGAAASGSSAAPTPSAAVTAPVNAHTSNSSPAHSQATSTPVASPSIANQPRPATTKPAPVSVTPAPVSAMPWPMPTVAANTVSPVLGTATTGEQRTTSYYRPRPSDSSAKSFLYQANGRATQETK